MRIIMTVTICVVSSSGVFHVLGAESQGYVIYYDDCNGDVDDYAEAGREATEHWDENNNDNDDFILSVFFFFSSGVEPWEQKAKDMLDVTMTALMMFRSWNRSQRGLRQDQR